jgi:hypothetical protein
MPSVDIDLTLYIVSSLGAGVCAESPIHLVGRVHEFSAPPGLHQGRYMLSRLNVTLYYIIYIINVEAGKPELKNLSLDVPSSAYLLTVYDLTVPLLSCKQITVYVKTKLDDALRRFKKL